jgi:hypothetical protein
VASVQADIREDPPPPPHANKDCYTTLFDSLNSILVWECSLEDIKLVFAWNVFRLLLNLFLLPFVYSWAYPPFSLLRHSHFPPPSMYMTYLLPDRFNSKAMSSALCVNTCINSTGICLYCRYVFGSRFALLDLYSYGCCFFWPSCHYNLYSFRNSVSGYSTDSHYSTVVASLASVRWIITTEWSAWEFLQMLKTISRASHTTLSKLIWCLWGQKEMSRVLHMRVYFLRK